MKINLGKLLRVLGRVIVAAPVIIEAVKPVVRKGKAHRSEDTTAVTAAGPRLVDPNTAPIVGHRYGT